MKKILVLHIGITYLLQLVDDKMSYFKALLHEFPAFSHPVIDSANFNAPFIVQILNDAYSEIFDLI